MFVVQDVFLKSITFQQHLIIGLLIRVVLVIYSEIHDENSELPYTDIDYKVVTDGAEHILNGESPFRRHTFRYSPILSIILIPNIILHKSFGKLLFSVCDLLVAILIQRIVHNELKSTFHETLLNRQKRLHPQQQQQELQKSLEIGLPDKFTNLSKISSFLWLYNPLSMIISTRGNGDSFSSIFVLAALYFLQKFNRSKFDVFLSGLCHGVAIHLRLYPIVFSLSLYLCLARQFSPQINLKNLLKIVLQPNLNQILLVFGTVISLFTLTGLFYRLYGWEYVHEAFLYHLIRKDIRHNFSLYFLLQYLGTGIDVTILENILIAAPKFIILFYLSVTFGVSMKTVSFCIFCQTFIMVTYNTVVTSQYFIWYLTVFPLCIKNLKNIPNKLAITYFCLWLLGQGLWLLPAYLLEYKCWNTFNFIGIQSICFFFINIFILQRFVYNFDLVKKNY